MTISMAFLLIVILLLYDFMFLKILLNRKRKIKFSIYIENGEIQSTEGDIAAEFLSETKVLCKIYKPGKVKITAVLKKHSNQHSYELQFSGTLPDELKTRLVTSFLSGK
jgi:hypothetical protein